MQAEKTQNDIIREPEPWQLAMDATSDGLWDINLTTGKVFYSERWKQMLGYKGDEIGDGLEELTFRVHSEDLSNLEHDLEAHYSGEKAIFQNEHRMYDKQGNCKWILARGYVVERTEDGTPLRMIGTHTDITHLKLVQSHFHTSTEIFASTFNYSGIGMALVSIDGDWLEVNRSICDMLGYTREELLELRFQDITYAEDLVLDFDVMEQLLKGKIDTYQFEKRYVSKSGKLVWGILNVSVVHYEDGSPKFFISQIVDITLQKELIRQLNDQNRQLTSAAQGLEQKMSQMHDLNHMIAHNLRGPAASISMLLETQEKSPDVMPVQDVLSMVKNCSKSLIGSLNTLMELAQLRLDPAQSYETCNLAGIINGIEAQLQPVIFQKHAQIVQWLKEKTVQYPKAYLESILYNLISNALKYSRPEVPPLVIVSAQTMDEQVVISVKDNGLGMDLPQYGDRVFKLNQTFHQGNDSMGVGLFITKSMIESLGGSITVSSQLGKGTEFKVTL